MEGKNFPSYHWHFLMLKTAFRHFFLGGGGVGGVWGVKNPSLLHLHSVTLEKSPTQV